MHAHLTEEELERLLSKDDEAWHRLFLHHLEVCPDCRAVAGDILDMYVAGEIGLDLCSIDIALARSRREAPKLLEQLWKYPAKRRRALLEDTPRFKSWGLCELLCAESERVASENPDEAVVLAEHAAAISAALSDWEPVEPAWHDELRGYALAALGNARRVKGDLAGAREAFGSSQNVWEPAYDDVGDALGYEARILAFEASLCRAERRLPEALRLLTEALAADPSPALRLKILVNQAKTFEELERLPEALQILDGLQAETEAADDRLRLCIAQNRLDYLSKAGRFHEAEDALPEVERLSGLLAAGAVDLLRLRWTKARVNLGLGRSEEALRLLQGVAEDFAERGLMYDTALCSLELAAFHASLGRIEDVLRTTGQALLLFSAVRVHREGLMALQVLAQAARERTLTEELLSQAMSILRIADECAA
jgi:tetratricopeptide (TPR) repeat protein